MSCILKELSVYGSFYICMEVKLLKFALWAAGGRPERLCRTLEALGPLVFLFREASMIV